MVGALATLKNRKVDLVFFFPQDFQMSRARSYFETVMLGATISEVPSPETQL